MKIYIRYIFIILWVTQAFNCLAQPNCNFTFFQGKTTGCYPYPILANAIDLSAGTNGVWKLETCTPGFLYTVPNTTSFSKTPPGPGCYKLTLSINGANGNCSYTAPVSITESDTPHISATLSKSIICLGSSVTLSLNVTPGCGTIDSTVVIWGCGNTTAVAGSPPSLTHVYDGSCVPGKYTITILVKNSCGCYAALSYPNAVTVVEQPTAGFSADVTSSACQPSLTSHFTADYKAQSGYPVTYCWYLDNNAAPVQCSNSPLFTHIFPQVPGKPCYTVKLVVTQPIGCSDSQTKTDYICVSPSPNLNFQISPASGTSCVAPGNKVALTLTGGPATWTITGPGPGDNDHGFGGTLIDNLSTPGCYDIKMVVNSGPTCIDSVTKVGAFCIKPLTVARYTVDDSFSCTPNYCVNFTNTTPQAAGSTYNWYFGGGTPATYTGYTPPPICYSGFGLRTDSLIVFTSNGCGSMTTKTINADTLKPSFTVFHVRGCAPLVTKIKSADIPLNFPEKIQSYNWTFSGPGAPTLVGQGLATATATFTTPGCYDIKLTVTTTTGCSSSVIMKQVVCVGTKPTPCLLTPNPLVKCYDSLPVVFNIQCDSFNQIIADYGDGPPESVGNANTRAMKAADSVKHIYQDCGEFDVKIVVMRDSCPSDTLRAHIKINCPKADFRDSISCLTGDSVYLINKSHGAEHYMWQILCLPPPNNVFYDTNLVVALPHCTQCSVRLFAYNDSLHCVNNKTNIINTPCNGPPSFTPDNISGCCGNYFPTFTNTTPGADNGSTFWDFNGVDGWGPRTPTSPLPGLCYGPTSRLTLPYGPGCGIFHMAMVYFQPGGCVDTVLRDMHMCQLTADFAPKAICLPDSVHFRPLATDSFCDGKFSYTWFFGATTSHLPNPVIRYPKPGVYGVTLVVTDSVGCSATITDSVLIGTTVNRAWSFDSTVCPGAPVCINNQTSSPVPLNETWTFTGGIPGSDNSHAPPCITYANEGDYPISYHILAGTCDTTETKTVHVHTPILSDSIDHKFSQCPPLLVTAINTSKYVDFLQDSITWIFYDTTRHRNFDISNASKPTEAFSLPGVYIVRMCVTTNDGVCTVCRDVDTILVEGPYGTITPDRPTACSCTDSINVTISTVNADSLKFLFGCSQGFNTLDSLRPIGTPDNPYVVNYKVSYCLRDSCAPELYVIDTFGCSVHIVGTPVFVDSPTVHFNYINYKVCDSGTIVFSDSTVYGLSANKSHTVSWAWDFGDNAITTDTSSVPNPSYYYSHPGNYKVKLYIQSNFGCVDSVTQEVIVFPRPNAYFALSDSEICSNLPVCLIDSSTSINPITNWLWDYGDGTVYTLDNKPPCNLYKPPYKPVYPITLTITDLNGCIDSSTIILRVDKAPIADFSWQITCETAAMPLNNTSQTPGGALDSCKWGFDVGAFHIENANCDIKYQFPPGFYPVQLEVTDVNGCKDTVMKTVESDSLTQLNVVPGDTTICLGFSVAYGLTGVFDSITWKPDLWLTHVDSQNVIITPLGDITYVLFAKSGVCPVASDTFTVNVVQTVPIGASATPNKIVLGQYSHLSVDSLPQGNHVVRIDSVTWTPASNLNCSNCQTPTASPQETTTYLVTAYYSRNIVSQTTGQTYNYRCTSTDEVTVTVLTTCDTLGVFIPNMFTPNGDGKNDLFKIRGQGASKINYLRIFDRWGELVFEIKNGVVDSDDWGWDGTNLRGEKLNEGVYVYECEVVCINHDVTVKRGSVTLLR